ncbi:DUF1697 domain-containing protein [Streptosporangiaceae bacterium NEAU-GS5]|nr:DUF1697 domain-containing protein [Streptosporangiaceae bacterium NEAU-GS5]
MAKGTARQVALLRGINVGRNNRVGMAPLRAMMEKAGFEDVKTHLQSGNIVYSTSKSAAAAAKEIERGLADELGVRVAVLVRTRDDLASIVKADPLADVASDPALYLVTFLSAKPKTQPIKDLKEDDHAPDVFRHLGREIYVWFPKGVRNATLTYQFWEKLLGVTATARNWRTVTRLLELCDA